MTWQFAWESPDPKRWSSNYTFSSYEEAKLSAIRHAYHEKRRKRKRLVADLEPKQQKLVWRSLRKAGWRIRRKLVHIDTDKLSP